jgi:hypothetical protein
MEDFSVNPRKCIVELYTINTFLSQFQSLVEVFFHLLKLNWLEINRLTLNKISHMLYSDLDIQFINAYPQKYQCILFDTLKVTNDWLSSFDLDPLPKAILIVRGYSFDFISDSFLETSLLVDLGQPARLL